MTFSVESLSDLAVPLAGYRKIWVALSGGLDSVVLLHALQRLQASQPDAFPNLSSLTAIHINHQLQADAEQWQSFCVGYCRELAIPLQLEKVDIDSAAGPSLEDLARQARYAKFAEVLGSGDCLLMAHHSDDQMETLLLRLMRGAGIKGLQGIPVSRPLGQSTLYRPLLNFTRQDLRQYATNNGLQWVEDHSNQDRSMDRNFCRHEILPLIASRWPGYRDSWRKTTALAVEAQTLLTEMAQQDLTTLETDQANILNLSRLAEFSDARQRNALKYWLQQFAITPSWNLLHRLSKQILKARYHRAMLKGDGWDIHRYRDRLYLLQPIPEFNQVGQLNWDPQQQQQLVLPGNGLLQARLELGVGLRLPSQKSLQVLTRHGGETLRLLGRPEKALNKLLQEQGVLPWLRPRLPLLYLHDQLVYVPGVGANEAYQAGTDEPGLSFSWQAPSFNYPSVL